MLASPWPAAQRRRLHRCCGELRIAPDSAGLPRRPHGRLVPPPRPGCASGAPGVPVGLSRPSAEAERGQDDRRRPPALQAGRPRRVARQPRARARQVQRHGSGIPSQPCGPAPERPADQSYCRSAPRVGTPAAVRHSPSPDEQRVPPKPLVDVGSKRSSAYVSASSATLSELAGCSMCIAVRSCLRRTWTGVPRASLLLMVATVIAAGVVAPAGASAETLLGSTLSDHYEGTTFGGEKVTVYQVGAPSETVAAPGPGTITSWSVRSGDMNAKYELRVIRPAAGGTYIAAGTSTPFTVPDAEDKVRGPFATHLPIKAGDRIALDVLSGLGAPVHLTLEPDELNYLQDPYVEGESKLPVLLPPLSATQELLLAATFVPGGPASTSPPTISGEAREGSTLTGSEGGWEI